MPGLAGAICRVMPRTSPALGVIATTMFAIVVAAPHQAHGKDILTPAAPPAPAPISVSPPVPYPYYPSLAQLRPSDSRTPKQRCWDDETANAGGYPTGLELRAIDLKCSQR